MSKVTEQAWNDLETENNTHQNELPLVIVNLCTAIDVNSIEPSDSGGDVLRSTLSGTSESLALQQEQDMISIDGNLINAYLGQGPLHIRRTLDQFYYLGMASTKERDGDQVVAKRPLTELLAEELDKSTKSKKPAPADSRQETKPASNQKIIMVDQLWLWIVDQGINSFLSGSILKPDTTSDTVITSFPQRWSGLDASNDVIDGVLQIVQNHLKSPHRHALKSVYDLASLIINNCTSAFESFRASGNHQYLDVFDNSICDIVNSVYRFKPL
jgi:hypothetical protein